MFNPDILPSLKDVIAAHDLRAEKKLGQNFLLDGNVTDKIARLSGDLSGKSVFEIGPGPGGLTRSLLKVGAKKIIAVEFDARAVRALQDLKNAVGERLEIMQGDALAIDLTKISAPPRAIVANLPYNIATTLLVGWMQQIREIPQAFDSMTLMFQKEVSERIIAKPGIKAYGRLSVLCQWLCDVKKVYELPPSAFTPPPKVSSAIVHFIPKTLDKNAPSFDDLSRVTAAAFGQRRKMIRSSMKAYLPKIEECGIDPALRAENLGVEDFIRLTQK